MSARLVELFMNVFASQVDYPLFMNYTIYLIATIGCLIQYSEIQ